MIREIRDFASTALLTLRSFVGRRVADAVGTVRVGALPLDVRGTVGVRRPAVRVSRSRLVARQ